MSETKRLQESLENIGLSEGELILYTLLLEQGSQPVASLVSKSGLKKGDCYNKLYSLVEYGLIEEFDQLKKKHYRLSDPRSLENLAAKQYQSALNAKRELEAVLPQFISAYTLTYHKPGVVFFEGEEAMRRVLEDTLTTKGEVLQYVDITAFIDQFPEINSAYVQKRSKLKQHKRVICPDTVANHNYGNGQDSKIFSIRFLSQGFSFENVSMYLYDQKIAYLTLNQERMVGVIIEDALISSMHRQLFESQWQQGKR